MSNETTSYLVTNIDKTKWRKFRGRAILNGFNSAGACLREYIEKYSEGKIKWKNTVRLLI